MLTETIELAQLLGFRKGGGQVETDPWANFLEKVVDAAPAIAEMILSTRQAQPPQQQQQQPQQAATIPPPPAEEAEDEEEEGDQPQVSKKEQDIMTRLEPVIRTSVPEMIRTVNAKEPAALRKWFLEEHGRSSFELLKAHLGPERMAEMATTHPAIRPMVPSKPVVLQFFEAVFAE